MTAPLVYANYGRPEDFDALEAAHVSVEGAIVITRYGELTFDDGSGGRELVYVRYIPCQNPASFYYAIPPLNVSHSNDI